MEVLAVTTIPLKLIETTSDEEQPFASVPTTVYVVNEVGEAIGFEITGLSSDPDGVHK